MIKIVVATDLARLPKEAREYVEGQFDRLAFKGVAKVLRPPSSSVALDSSVFDDCDVVVTRPTGGLWTKIHPNDFKNNRRDRVHLFTVSAGTDSLGIFKEARFEKYAPHFANEAGVAAYTMMTAADLLFRSSIGSVNLGRGNFSGAQACTSLAGKTWAIYGTGQQVGELIDLLQATGVERVIIYSDRIEPRHFDVCTARLEHRLPLEKGGTPSVVENAADGFHAEMTIPRKKWNRGSRTWIETTQKFTVQANLSLEDSFRDADVVSIHVPLVWKAPAPKGGRQPTEGMIDKDFLKFLKDGAVLINVSRGEVLNEAHVLEALKRDKLGGVAVDVLNSDVEYSSDDSKSALWTAFKDQAKTAGDLVDRGEARNLIVTPHIAGSVDTDIMPMWESVIEQICRLAGEHA